MERIKSTTALPIASLFYRAWGETVEEFTDAAEEAAALGLRVYLGPAYRTGNQVVDEDGTWLHAGKSAIGTECHAAQVVVIADTAKHQVSPVRRQSWGLGMFWGY